MKIKLKILSLNRFGVYHSKPDEVVFLGEYKGSIATVKRLLGKNLAIPESEIEIERMKQKGWY
jgi:hypothetical protein